MHIYIYMYNLLLYIYTYIYVCVFVSHYYPIRWPSNKSHRHMETLTKRTISAKLDSKLVFRIYRRCQRDINLFFFLEGVGTSKKLVYY